MGLENRKPGWLSGAMLALAAACAAVSAPADAGRRTATVATPSKLVPAVNASCIDDEGADPQSAPTSQTVPVAPSKTPLPADVRLPRINLLTMVQEAVRRSNSVGASQLLADAAAVDVDETRAGRLPQVSLSGQVGGIESGAPATTTVRGPEYQGALTASMPLYDGGKIHDLTDWRRHLAEAAQLSEITAQEQVALQTVSLALDRSRYTLEARVYDQYVHKIGCLVQALQTIVNIDHGRLSELVQAQKTQQQAQLSRDQTLSQIRLIEIRLRRFVGDALPPVEGITTVMLDTPSLPDLLTVADQASEIEGLGAQADAMDSYVRAVLDGRKPQLGLLLQATKADGASSSHVMSGGISFSIPLFNPALTYTASAARKRASAARLQREDALEARKSRMSEVYEQAQHAMDRARAVVDILHNSELVRNFTLLQWQQLGRRSLFDVMSAEGDHYNLRVQYVDALYDTQQANALLWSLGLGLAVHLQ